MIRAKENHVLAYNLSILTNGCINSLLLSIYLLQLVYEQIQSNQIIPTSYSVNYKYSFI